MQTSGRWIKILLTLVGLQTLVIAVLITSGRTQLFPAIHAGWNQKSDAPKSAAPTSSTPAKIVPLKDSSLKQIILTARAAERLEIKTAAVREQQFAGNRLVRTEGEVVALPTASTVVKSPVSGVVSPASDTSVALPGTRLSAGETVFRLASFADLMPTKKEQTAAVTTAVFRPAILGHRTRQALSQPPQLASEPGESRFVSVEAPRDSTLLKLLVQPGQVVVAGQSLFEIADLSEVLVRVPLANDLRTLSKMERNQPARVVPLGSKSDSTRVAAASLTGTPIEAPAGIEIKELAEALYYVVKNPDHGLIPGQHVRVERLPIVDETPRKVIPYAALLYDADGSSWTYTNPEPLVFVRHRVSVDHIVNDLAVLSEGPPSGTPVVTVGASELFGAEFRIGH
jgi:multidrug efflux pump subunit AcrA (membrane-fusion protein)